MGIRKHDEYAKKLKRRNIVFYDSKFGRENITREVPSFDFVESRFGVKLHPSSLVIDVGCGTASNLLSLNGDKKVALDISSVNLTLARERSSKLMLVQADAEYIPFRERVFDVVLMVDLLHHVPNPDAAIKEVNRILRRGGQLFVWDACIDGVKPIYPVAMFIEKISEKIGNCIENLGPSRYQTVKWLEQNDFKILKGFGEGSFIRYMDSVLECFFKRFGTALPYHLRRVLIMIESKVEHSFSKNFPLKLGIIATNSSALLGMEPLL